MKFVLALLIIIFCSCNKEPSKPYFKRTMKTIHSVKANKNKDGHVVCTVLFKEGGFAIVGEEKGLALQKGDTITVISYD